MADTREAIASVDALADGEMLQADVGSTSVLLSRIDGQFYAVGAHCTHYGAPLAEGVLHGSTLTCPWHHAVFDVTDGDHLQPPGRDCLTHFDVSIEDGQVYVTVPEGADEHRLPHMQRRSADDTRHFVILGAGAAGSSAAETLRAEGFGGRITLVGADPDPPYDRPALTKSFLSDADGDPTLRQPAFYADDDIDLETGKTATAVRRGAQTVEFDDGSTLGYDRLLVATGSEPRRLDVPGAGLDGIYYMRSLADARALSTAAEKAETAVVIGSSFIGMETASALTRRGLDVTVVSVDRLPFLTILGPSVGHYFLDLHRDHGVSFELGIGVEKFEGHEHVEAVELAGGGRLEADLVVVGVGVRPRTDMLGEFDLAGDGGVDVDETLRVDEDVFAAGDIARFPDFRTGERIRIEHWRTANQHGQVAARAMLDRPDAKYREIPFFWTRQFDVSVKYVGHATAYEEVVFDGTVSGGEFVAYYLRDGTVRAACGTRGDVLTAIQDILSRNPLPRLSELRNRRG